MRKKIITVVIAEDHIMVREGLRKLLEPSGEFEIVGEADTGQAAVELVRASKPDIVIIDISMPILNGIEATHQIKSFLPDCKILVLSAHGDDEYVERFLELGASGYILKQNSGQILLDAIREIVNGGSYFSESIAIRLRHQRARARIRGDKGVTRPALTSREIEVLQMVAEGFANKEIAAQLSISIKTVEKHRQQLMDKLNIHQTAGLTRYAIDSGIVECVQQDENCPKY